jgi:hypothetical protein
MVNYQDGRIYKLVGSGLTYYGSTTQNLAVRKAGHKRQNNKCKSRILFENGEVDIVLVEKYPCNSKEELHSRERWYIENNECINKQIPTRTTKEWRELNKDKKKEFDKEYYENNKDKIKDRNKEYRKANKDRIKDRDKEWRELNKDKLNKKILCECGGSYLLKHKSTHFKTDKHKNLILVK